MHGPVSLSSIEIKTLNFSLVAKESHENYPRAEGKRRRLQDSNLRGQSPVDFESTSLTTRTNRHTAGRNSGAPPTPLRPSRLPGSKERVSVHRTGNAVSACVTSDG